MIAMFCIPDAKRLPHPAAYITKHLKDTPDLEADYIVTGRLPGQANGFRTPQNSLRQEAKRQMCASTIAKQGNRSGVPGP